MYVYTFKIMCIQGYYIHKKCNLGKILYMDLCGKYTVRNHL